MASDNEFGSGLLARTGGGHNYGDTQKPGAPASFGTSQGSAGGGHHSVDIHIRDAPAPIPPAKEGRRALAFPKPRRGPLSATIAPAKKRGRQRATQLAQPNAGAPSAPFPTPSGDGSGDGQNAIETHGCCAVAAICSSLIELEKVRRFCITQQSRCDRSMEAFIATQLGYHTELSEKEGKAIFARAKAIRENVEKGSSSDDFPPFLIGLCLRNAQSRSAWDEMRETTEDKMRAYAKQTPVWPWVKENAKGFSDKALGVLIGNVCGASAPTLGDYRTVSGLWSRLGLGVMPGGERQSKMSNKAKLLNEAGEPSLRYSPSRRAALWGFIEPMFRHQWAGDKDEDGNDPKKTGKPVAVPAHAKEPYGEIYGRRRKITAPRVTATEDLPAKVTRGGVEILNPDKWTPARCKNDALRVMTKALVRNIWLAWRRASKYPEPMVKAPSADQFAEAAE